MDRNEIRWSKEIRGRKWKMERDAQGPRPAGPRLWILRVRFWIIRGVGVNKRGDVLNLIKLEYSYL